MLSKNVGTADRVVRVLFGVALLAGFVMNTEATYRWMYLIGIVPIVTGLFSVCPLYSVLGIKTCPRSSDS